MARPVASWTLYGLVVSQFGDIKEIFEDLNEKLEDFFEKLFWIQA